MLSYPNIDPVAFSIGPLSVHWYGVTYLVGFIGGLLLGKLRAAKPNSGWTQEQVADLLFYIAIGIIVGGRVGYVFFYGFSTFIDNPLWLFKIWEGGMSFHGGMLGVVLMMYFFGRKYKKPFFTVTDFIVPLVPIGLGAGRIGNFIGGELWGRVSDVPWAMVFPKAGDLSRHPSQLYEVALEGVVLFIILWLYSSRPKPMMAVSGMFALCYGFFRSFVEFFREPDKGLDFIAFNWLTMGQLLSIPMIMIGLFLIVWGYKYYPVKDTQ